MLIIHLPVEFRVGMRHPCRINFEPTTVFWRDQNTLVIGENDARHILGISPPDANGLRTFSCTAADGSGSIIDRT